MQFKQPEILFALLLLIIPIIVHLFQLQRFVKVPFTNVKFLRKIESQTRKSSQLKKWIILALRMLVFTCVIFAFSRPYFSDRQKNTKRQTFIYLDNSFSMSYADQGQEIFKKSIQELIENIDENSTVTLLTNEDLFLNLDQKSLKNTLLKLNYSASNQTFEEILFRINKELHAQPNTLNNIILISDFQNIKKLKKLDVTNVNAHISLISVAPSSAENVFIDSVYIQNNDLDQITLKVTLNNTNLSSDNISIALHNDTKLIGKTTTPLSKNKKTTVEFSIPLQENFNGIINIDKDNLPFDNTLFFNLSKPAKINVLSIGKSTLFLPKIFTKNEFNFQHKNSDEINYNQFKNQHLIILNAIDKISNALSNALLTFQNNGGNLIVIPSQNIEIPSYNHFLSPLNIGTISSKSTQELSITSINYEHPILRGVFEKKVTNFQYPKVLSYYKSNFKNSSPIVSYQNNEQFVGLINNKLGNIYWFSASLALENGNFQNSPLIVPVLYNIARNSSPLPQLYYTIGNSNEIEIEMQLKNDEIVKLVNNLEELIPMQEVYQNSVKISTTSKPNIPGFYTITHNSKSLKTVAYNYNRLESDLKYTDIFDLFETNDNLTLSNAIKQTINQYNNQQKINWVFRWFLGFAVLFLLIEIFILKFFKI